MPSWAGHSNNGPDYRFVATREALRQQWALPGHEDAVVDPDSIETAAGVRYKIRGTVTNRTIDGNELIAWYRERCGLSEQVHSVMKEDLTGGRMPERFCRKPRLVGNHDSGTQPQRRDEGSGVAARLGTPAVQVAKFRADQRGR